jgi:hypothetical protein
MRPICAVLAAAAALAGAGPATAAQPRQIAPGVYADPSTPAGKEYALQLQQARGTGSPPPSATSHSSSPALFGAGIAPAKSAAQARPVAKPATHKQAATSTRPQPSTTTTTPTGARVAAPATAGSSSGGGTLALVGGAAAILALGGLGGVLMRRRRLEPTSDRGIR